MEEQQQLLRACKEGKFEEVKRIYKNQNINLNIKDENYPGSTPLIYACFHGHFEIVKLLLNDKRTNINLRNSNGSTGFSCSCGNGNVEIVKLMLRYEDLEVNKANNDGWTPLMVASFYGHLEIVQLVLGSGREVNLSVKNKWEKTATDLAREKSTKEKEDWETEEIFQKRVSNCSNIVKLLKAFENDSIEARIQLRKQLGLSGKIFQVFLYFFITDW